MKDQAGQWFPVLILEAHCPAGYLNRVEPIQKQTGQLGLCWAVGHQKVQTKKSEDISFTELSEDHMKSIGVHGDSVDVVVPVTGETQTPIFVQASPDSHLQVLQRS